MAVAGYVCIGRETDHTCKQAGLDANALELVVSLQVTDALLHPEAAMRLAREQRGQFGNWDEAMVRLDAIAEQLARLPEAKSKLVDAYTEGTIGKAMFKEKVAGLEARQERLEEERETLQASLGQAQVDEVDAARLAELLAEHRADISRLPKVKPAQWAEIMRAVLRRVTITKDGSLRFDAIIPFLTAEEPAKPRPIRTLARTSRKRSRTK
jgi:hypothetical protein